ncbi:MAG: putative D,D-dipeptide transport system permease protein ddpB [Pseudomonadota bacterium]
MLRFIARRFAGLVLTLLGASLVTFFISHVIPTDVARLIAGDGASEEIVAGLRTKLGLDQPIWVQYGLYLQDLAQGDLGVSIRSGQPVAEELLRAAPATLELALAAFVLIVAGGLGLGALAALSRGRLLDKTVRAFSILSISTPTFWSALVLIAVVSVVLQWAPLGGRIDPELAPPATRTGFLVLDSILDGRWDALASALHHLLLPALTLALAALGGAIRLVRATLLESLSQDYVMRARASGLSTWRVLSGYAMPSALVPFVTVQAIVLGDLFAGAVVTEMIFGWPGLGSYTLGAVAGLDFPAIMGFTLLASAGYACANLVADLLVARIDPRAAAAS